MDDDTICGNIDNCPETANTDQADNDGDDEGLHANFKLSKDSESIILTNGNVILDKINFTPQISDISSGRNTLPCKISR